MKSKQPEQNYHSDDILSEAQDGWDLVHDQHKLDLAEDKINAFINKTLDTKKKIKSRPIPKNKFNLTVIGLVFLLVVIFITFALILKII